MNLELENDDENQLFIQLTALSHFPRGNMDGSLTPTTRWWITQHEGRTNIHCVDWAEIETEMPA